MFKQVVRSLAMCVLLIVSAPAKGDVIYHDFDTPFKVIKANLNHIKDLGYTYIQISPPQKSHDGNEWFFRYQPIDYTKIEGPLGSENDLKEMISAAHNLNIKLIADVVLNHMADEDPFVSTLKYPRFSSQDFHPKTCINFSVIRGWLGKNCDLPDLATESTYVRQEAKNYLKKLSDLGFDGFRFDAAKHIEPDFFTTLRSAVPSSKFFYGENIPQNSQNSNEFAEYTDPGNFSIEDFFLTRTMIDAFNREGDLRSLADVNLVGKRRALPGVVAVTFARNHDTAKHTIDGFSFSDLRDALLADAFILARSEGFPLIYGGDFRQPESREPGDSSFNDAEQPMVVAGVRFHEKMMGKPQFFVNGNQIAPGADNPNTLFVRRGAEGLAIINKAGDFFDVAAAKMPGMDVGCYRELNHNFDVSINRGGDGNNFTTRWGTSARGGIQIGPRDALFLVKTSSTPCP